MIQIGLLGGKGRMGQHVTRLLANHPEAKLTVIADRGDDFSALLKTDVIIDFSLPEATLELLTLAEKSTGKLPAFVIGSTGWSPNERAQVERLAKRTPLVISSNFSTGVLAMTQILKWAAPKLRKLGYTPVIVETHHRHKKDAPSGTAITLQKAIAPGEHDSVQTHSIRAGEIVGDHETTFYGPADHVTIGHFAQDRSVFAYGAIDVALWLSEKRNEKNLSGPFTMDQFFEERLA